MKNPLFEIVKRSKFVTIRKDFIYGPLDGHFDPGIPITRIIVKDKDVSTIPMWLLILIRFLDWGSGLYGYRLTIDYK